MTDEEKFPPDEATHIQDGETPKVDENVQDSPAIEVPVSQPGDNEPFNIETKTLKEAIDKSDDTDEVFNMDNVVDDPTDL